MRFKAVFFDLDGTLIDTERAHHEAWSSLVRQLGGQAISDDEYSKLIGLSPRAIAERLIEKYRLPTTASNMLQFKRKMVMGIYAKAPLREGAAELIRQLRPVAKLGIATGSPRIVAAQAFARLGTDFDVTVCGDEIARPKPAPDIYLRAADIVGIKPEECLVFEDSQPGIDAARAAGMHVIAIASAYTKTGGVKGADRIIESFREFSPKEL